MSLDQFPSADGKPPPKPAHGPAPEETDEDLFDFDELGAAAGKAAAAAKELDASLAKVGAAAADVAKTVNEVKAPQAAPVAAAKPAPAPAPAAKSAPAPAPTAAASEAKAAFALPATKLVLALAAALVLTNVALTIVSWSSSNSVRKELDTLGHDVIDAAALLRTSHAAATGDVAAVPPLAYDQLPEGYRTIQLCKERIERGEFERARRALYGLLAIVDRIGQPARGELEAQAEFLIADSWRVQAQRCAASAPAEEAAPAKPTEAPKDEAPAAPHESGPAPESESAAPHKEEHR